MAKKKDAKNTEAENTNKYHYEMADEIGLSSRFYGYYGMTGDITGLGGNFVSGYLTQRLIDMHERQKDKTN